MDPKQTIEKAAAEATAAESLARKKLATAEVEREAAKQKLKTASKAAGRVVELANAPTVTAADAEQAKKAAADAIAAAANAVETATSTSWRDDLREAF